MHPTKTLLLLSLTRQSVAFPLHHEPHSLLHSLLFNSTDLSSLAFPLARFFQPVARGIFPSQCLDDAATEEQGCYTLQDESNNNVRLALAPGQTFDEGGLGSGAFGKVAQCVLKDGQDIAVKIYRSSETNERMCERSFQFLKELEDNDHVVKAVARGKAGGRPALAMELAPDGTIDTGIKNDKFKGKVKEETMKEVGTQILDGFAYMHSKKIAHRDIYPRNIAFKGDTAKIIDLDYSCKDQDCVQFVPGGDWGLAAPEGLSDSNNPDAVKKIDPLANDVWTTATLFLRMTTGEAPPRSDQDKMREIWENDDADKRVELIKKIWPNFSQEFCELLADIFCKQEQRIKMDQFKEDFADTKIYC